MKKIAIIGASYLQLPLVEKANQMGIETHCFSWESGAVCKSVANCFYPVSVLDKESILNICKGIGIDGITTIATDIATPTISFVAERLGLISNYYWSALLSTNKILMRQQFFECSIKCPKFFLVQNLNYSPELEKYFPLIVKPADRSGSIGVNKVTNINELKRAIKLAISESFSKEAIIEEYIEGSNEVSVESISWNGKHYILAITDKVTTGAPNFVEIAHHQPSELASTIQEKITFETQRVLNALEIKFGASHAEFKINEDGDVFVIEVGARMGGDFIGSHLVQLSTGYDFLKGVIDVSLDTFHAPKTKMCNFSGVYFLSEETKKILPFFNKENEFDVIKEVLSSELKRISRSGDRSGYLIYRHNNKVNLL